MSDLPHRQISGRKRLRRKFTRKSTSCCCKINIWTCLSYFHVVQMAEYWASVPAPAKPRNLSFLDLPSELRVRIYRNCLVVGDVRIVDQSRNFPPDNEGYAYHVVNASSQLLQTCQTCYSEGRPILYGENTFDFPYPASLTYFLSRIPFLYAKDWIRSIRIQPRIYWSSSLDKIETFSNLKLLTLDACDSVFEMAEDKVTGAIEVLPGDSETISLLVVSNLVHRVGNAEIWARGFPKTVPVADSLPQVCISLHFPSASITN
jgi:hypothetical protein